MSWTEERVEIAKELWSKGSSAGAIAKVLNDRDKTFITRNAVIGKLHRLGISERGVPSLGNKKPRPPRMLSTKVRVNKTPVVAKGRTLQTPPPPLDESGLPVSRISLFDAGKLRCKYPVSGDGADTMVCGMPNEGALSMCSHHLEICSRSEARKPKKIEERPRLSFYELEARRRA